MPKQFFATIRTTILGILQRLQTVFPRLCEAANAFNQFGRFAKSVPGGRAASGRCRGGFRPMFPTGADTSAAAQENAERTETRPVTIPIATLGQQHGILGMPCSPPTASASMLVATERVKSMRHARGSRFEAVHLSGRTIPKAFFRRRRRARAAPAKGRTRRYKPASSGRRPAENRQ